jgi:hypothetical protein
MFGVRRFLNAASFAVMVQVMSACFDTKDVQELSNATLAESDKRLSTIPADMCAPFFAEASNLQQQLLSVYRTVVLCVRKEDDVDRVGGWWQIMVEVCDQFARRLLALHRDHPNCGAGMFYDAVLDLRNRCQRLREMHS